MELFSELYGLYYRIAEDILNRAPLTRAQIQELTAKSGFAESILQLAPKLLDGGEWPLLEERDGRFYSRLSHPVRVPVSLLELRWLKSVLCDPRARLFLEDREIARLEELLFEVPPLFDPEDFVHFDRYRDGDDYYSFDYIQNFRRVLCALRQKKPVEIIYRTGAHGSAPHVLSGNFVPLKLEYSEKDDKFRAYCALVRYGKFVRCATINLGRILSVGDSSERCRVSPSVLSGWFARTRSPEPITVEVFPERNAAERFLLEFSSYEKQSEFDEATGVCRVRLWYPVPDETELLIRILGFGPTVRVLGPKDFLRKVRERVQAQSRLLPPFPSDSSSKGP